MEKRGQFCLWINCSQQDKTDLTGGGFSSLIYSQRSTIVPHLPPTAKPVKRMMMIQ
ncbi:hypothetical protein DPMN_182517 [Dreissena polymorpha]|uniref:Uncharacterized protein n=1 Tax=Dreissena polymorpha TaxID=45954 RepID=A0A9D4DGF0_DREPO|nr:hypothetical protein DPMN_182517 [Dreissena polymorpha]